MKKIIVALIGIVAFIPSADADLKVAAVGGITSANFSYENTTLPGATVSSRSMMSYGLLANFRRGSSFGVSFGFLYSELGGKVKYSQSGVEVTIDEKYPYFQIPLIADYWLNRFIAVGVGGYYAFSGGNVTQDLSIAGVSTSTTQSFDDHKLESTDYGLLGHLQIVFPIMTRAYFTVNAMYEIGFTQISKDPTTKIYNRAFIGHVGVGYMF